MRCANIYTNFANSAQINARSGQIGLTGTLRRFKLRGGATSGPFNATSYEAFKRLCWNF